MSTHDNHDCHHMSTHDNHDHVTAFVHNSYIMAYKLARHYNTKS